MFPPSLQRWWYCVHPCVARLDGAHCMGTEERFCRRSPQACSPEQRWASESLTLHKGHLRGAPSHELSCHQQTTPPTRVNQEAEAMGTAWWGDLRSENPGQLQVCLGQGWATGLDLRGPLTVDPVVGSDLGTGPRQPIASYVKPRSAALLDAGQSLMMTQASPDTMAASRGASYW